jgi:hypothetical protein
MLVVEREYRAISSSSRGTLRQCSGYLFIKYLIEGLALLSGRSDRGASVTDEMLASSAVGPLPSAVWVHDYDALAMTTGERGGFE